MNTNAINRRVLERFHAEHTIKCDYVAIFCAIGATGETRGKSITFKLFKQFERDITLEAEVALLH